MELSIVTVNWNAYDFAHVLLSSIEQFTSCSYEVILVDNSDEKEKLSYKNLTVLQQNHNIGHGAGLNLGIQAAKAPYTCFFDIDCHILAPDWNVTMLREMIGIDVLGGRGVKSKPIRPACMFLKTDVGKRYDYRSTPGYKGHRVTPEGFDVAIKAYHQMIEDNCNLQFLESTPSRYGTLNGEEWLVGGKPMVYHHWHGSHLKERQADFKESLSKDKEKLFKQLVWYTL